MLKISLMSIGTALLVFILTSGISIQFRPFHISFSYPCFGIGMVLIAIGFGLCVGSARYHGRKFTNGLFKPHQTAYSTSHSPIDDMVAVRK